MLNSDGDKHNTDSNTDTRNSTPPFRVIRGNPCRACAPANSTLVQSNIVELLTQYKQGDPRAFRALVERYTTPIFNLAFRLLRDPMEAENVTQETFLRVVAALDRVRLDLPFKPYLFRIAVNLCRDYKRRKQPVLFSDLDHAGARDEGGAGESASESIAADAPPLWERLEREELHAQLHAAMEHLPPIYQTVIILRYVEDFSYPNPILIRV